METNGKYRKLAEIDGGGLPRSGGQERIPSLDTYLDGFFGWFFLLWTLCREFCRTCTRKARSTPNPSKPPKRRDPLNTTPPWQPSGPTARPPPIALYAVAIPYRTLFFRYRRVSHYAPTPPRVNLGASDMTTFLLTIKFADFPNFKNRHGISQISPLPNALQNTQFIMILSFRRLWSFLGVSQTYAEARIGCTRRGSYSAKGRVSAF